MRVSAEDARLAYHCVLELVMTRRGNVPYRVHRLIGRLRSAAHGMDVEPLEPQSETEDGELIDSTEAAELLKCSTRWVTRIAADLGGRKVSGSWVFRRSDVIEYGEGRQTA